MGKSKSRISNNIRTLRFHLNEMTQQDLADITGVTRQTIIAIEGAKYSPSLELAFRIAGAFNAKLEDVFTFDQKEEK
jgi:putative transcriptional regulator